MKKLKTLYWIFTGLLVAFLMLTSVSQIISSKSSEGIMNILHMPLYMLTFLGTAKLLAVVAVLIPGYPKIKEWAYAGLMFDFIGATYAMIAVGGTIDKWSFMIVPILLWGLSYYLFGKIRRTETEIHLANKQRTTSH
ncbi:DoxX family protein [Terrimonas alba]|uniref:DoxX family protein n=1 Tax=Terrimonas alba TaxID=3349636 RepID=UPI0035F47BEE